MKKETQSDRSSEQRKSHTNKRAKGRARRTHAPRRSVGAPAQAQSTKSGGSGAGAPPFNTAPANCNDPKILRGAIDSLYLSFHGSLGSDTLEKLKDLKRKAQSPERSEQPKAQYRIGDHLFEVMDKGHITGAAAYREMREHVLRTLETHK